MGGAVFGHRMASMVLDARPSQSSGGAEVGRAGGLFVVLAGGMDPETQAADSMASLLTKNKCCSQHLRSSDHCVLHAGCPDCGQRGRRGRWCVRL